jgi:glycosyltransferase involved in cell wall biosynthesis
MYARATFKGTDVAIRACELARERLPNLRVIAFGESASHADCPVPDWIELEQRPSQARIAEIYASCDAWLFASRCEGFGLPILEAMACRTPLIGTPTGLAPETIADGGGILVGMEDAADMANAIVEIAGMDEAAWRRLSDAAVATAGRFRWDLSAAAFEGCLLRAVSQRRRPAAR